VGRGPSYRGNKNPTSQHLHAFSGVLWATIEWKAFLVMLGCIAVVIPAGPGSSVHWIGLRPVDAYKQHGSRRVITDRANCTCRLFPFCVIHTNPLSSMLISSDHVPQAKLKMHWSWGQQFFCGSTHQPKAQRFQKCAPQGYFPSGFALDQHVNCGNQFDTLLVGFQGSEVHFTS